MANIPITVTIDPNNNVRCNPDSAKAHLGDNTIVWRAGTPGMSIDSVTIEPSSGQPAWPGSSPAKQPDGTVSATDPVASAPGRQRYKYSVSVTKNGQSFSVDPEVDNDPTP
ncbi:MAG: hypothetical protein HYU52_05730 [Acidobacteria bacterium]|nr:hypothetical protein [Acidobacteriota bacterium]